MDLEWDCYKYKIETLKNRPKLAKIVEMVKKMTKQNLPLVAIFNIIDDNYVLVVTTWWGNPK